MHTPHLRDLIDDAHSAWPLVTEWIGNARVAVEVLPSTSPNREATLLALDVTTRSALGAIAWKTGGILVDHGWLRLLGSGHPRLSGSLQTWMGGGNDAIDDPLASGLLVAHDAVGGFFAINGGGLPGALRNVCYFEPDTLRWSGLGTGYSGFLQWVVSGSLDAFYGELRWQGWQSDVVLLTGDRGYFIGDYPLTARSQRVTIGTWRNTRFDNSMRTSPTMMRA